jgi:small subunit ribosomal protein S8e
MAQWHLRSNRKPSGGRLNPLGKKRRLDRGSRFIETKIGERRVKVERGYGGGRKLNVLSEGKANIIDAKTGRRVMAKILTVVDNRANPHYIRRNVITKGAIIKTEAGLAKVTSRPGQDGVINAVLIEEGSRK